VRTIFASIKKKNNFCHDGGAIAQHGVVAGYAIIIAILNYLDRKLPLRQTGTAFHGRTRQRD